MPLHKVTTFLSLFIKLLLIPVKLRNGFLKRKFQEVPFGRMLDGEYIVRQLLQLFSCEVKNTILKQTNEPT